ncbi:MAG: PEP-CTERM sorting domain-containing protein [Mastigocoleus sp. MO_167.B18]|nr:PEP-CTERM sorting domain-containing protein [Mastigocoleus sp. MO_167.B18]
MKLFNKLTIAAVGIMLGMAASPAQAAILGVSEGGTIIDAPESTLPNATVSDKMQGFNEKQNIFLEDDLAVKGSFIQAGTLVNSHMIFLDSEQSSFLRKENIKWTFDGEILGIMSDSGGNLENASQSLLGLEDTTYNKFGARGLEGGDSYSIKGEELILTMQVTSPGDWIRVVTRATPESVPEPTSMLGLFAIGAFGTFSSLKRKNKQEA